MTKAAKFKKLLDFAYKAYQENNVTKQEYRQKGKVPYLIHPLWCAMILITDQRISWKERELGFQALILHDVLEDTSLKLPRWVKPAVKALVKEMTFKSWEEALREIPKKNNFVKLLLLVDALSSMYENHVSLAKRKKWKEITEKLLRDVEKNYGNIRLVQIGKAITKNTKW